MDTAYPDFGFPDALGFELRGDQHKDDNGNIITESECDCEKFTFWQYLQKYCEGNTKFERFNHIIE
mgnify:CR=1 FL=1